jgi:hypothetical protein
MSLTTSEGLISLFLIISDNFSPQELALKNAKETENGQFKVPSIMNEEEA